MRVKEFRYLLIALATSVVLSLIFFINSVGVAQSSAPQRATFESYSGTIRVYPNGRTPIRTPRAHGALRSDGRNRDHLWVAGDLRSWAHLQFWLQNRRIGPLVRAGVDRTDTRYIFPCRIRVGYGTFAWGLSPLGYSACEGIIVSLDDGDDLVASKASSQTLADVELTSPDEIKISRIEEQSLIRVYQRDNDIVVDALVGVVQISTLGGSIFDVGAGERYVQSAEVGNVERFDLNEVYESPSVEDFLDETNWSPEVEPLLEDLQSRLPSVEAQLTETEQEILDAHNELRAEVDVPSLSWSPELASAAQEWADTLSRENDFRHSDGSNGVSGAGENIAAGNSVGRMLRLWSREKEDFDLSTGQCRRGETCGHYSQMIWRRTTELGCGVAPHRRYGNVMVCNYNPPGNVIGRSPLQ